MIYPNKIQLIVGKWSKIYVVHVKFTNGHIFQHLLVIKKKHFIKQRIDGEKWKNNFDGYYELFSIEKK